MITQNEVPVYLEENLPEMRAALKQAIGPKEANVYTCVQCLTDFTRNMVKEHNYPMVRRCLAVAAKLYAKGNETVKGALENVYMFSFSSLLNSCEGYRERNLVQAAMPGMLYKVYVKQALKSAC